MKFPKVVGLILLLAGLAGAAIYVLSPVKPWNPFVAVYVVTSVFFGIKLLSSK